MLAVELWLLLFAANGAPVLAKRLLGDRYAASVDGGLVLPDERRLFGESKTWRGLGCAIVASALVAFLLGFDAVEGAWFGVSAMAGDLLSSFVKRRLGMRPSSMALGLDQIPESLLPLLAVRHAWGLTWIEIAAVTIAFFVTELAASRALFRLGIREQPY